MSSELPHDGPEVRSARHPARKALLTGPATLAATPVGHVCWRTAECLLISQSAIAHKPARLTFAEASTIPQPGAIALRGMRRAVAGSRVLINGAGGGSGSFAIQLAR